MERITVTINTNVLEWLNREVKTCRFRNVSHGVEFAVYELMKKEENETIDVLESIRRTKKLAED
jgi:Arc/MetJ-type ribon-helix-helix transcriptional regulator